MGLLDAIFGRRKLPPSRTELLSALAGAELTVRTELTHEPTGKAGLAVRSVAASEFDRARADLEAMLRLAGQDLGSTTSIVHDEYGYLWVLVSDEDFTDLVATAQIAAQTVAESGFRDQLLCAVFPFTGADGPLEIVYSFKRAKFYAFAPRPGQKREVALEIRAHSLLKGELPLEEDMSYRYPLWGTPL